MANVRSAKFLSFYSAVCRLSGQHKPSDLEYAFIKADYDLGLTPAACVSKRHPAAS